jgi:hypothetical protein
MAAKHWELKHPGAKVARQSEARAPPRAAARRRGGAERDLLFERLDSLLERLPSARGGS